MLKTIVAVTIIFKTCSCPPPRNTCKTLEDYRTLRSNPKCWYNPDVDLSPTDTIRRYGYPLEVHEVQTEDGFVLTLYRVPHNATDTSSRRLPVLLQHGIATDASNWFILGAQSLVFVLSNNGYDVWIANSRSSKYSRHIKYNPFEAPYWNFSFHEMGIYDVPAMIEHIVSKRGQRGEIRYVGHSMGCTMALVYASLKPDHARKNIKSMVALAPVAYMDHVSPLYESIAAFRDLIWEFSKSIGLYGVGSNLQFKLDLIHRLCRIYPFIVFCASALGLGTGVNNEEDQVSTLPVGVSQYPGGFALKTLLHYAQIIAGKKRFQLYDYGAENNRRLYNSSTPPEYPLDRIKLPVHLFYGKNDGLSQEKDVWFLYDKLQSEKTIMEVYGFTHLNFVAGLHAMELYHMLLTYL